MKINFITKLTEDDFKDINNFNSFKIKYTTMMNYLDSKYEKGKDGNDKYNRRYMDFHKDVLMDTNIDISEECLNYHFVNKLLHDLASVVEASDYFDKLTCGNIRIFDSGTLLIDAHGSRSFIIMDNLPIHFKLNSPFSKYLNLSDDYKILLIRMVDPELKEFNIYELKPGNSQNKIAIIFSKKKDMIVAVPKLSKNKRIIDLRYHSILESIIEDRVVESYDHRKESLCLNIAYLLNLANPDFVAIEGLWKIEYKNKYKDISTKHLMTGYMSFAAKYDLFTMYNLLKALSFMYQYNLIARNGLIGSVCCYCDKLSNNMDFSDTPYHCPKCDIIIDRKVLKIHNLLNFIYKKRYIDDFKDHIEFPKN